MTAQPQAQAQSVASCSKGARLSVVALEHLYSLGQQHPSELNVQIGQYVDRLDIWRFARKGSPAGNTARVISWSTWSHRGRDRIGDGVGPIDENALGAAGLSGSSKLELGGAFS